MKAVLRLAPLLVLALATHACLTLEPVIERMEIRLEPGDRATVTIETRIDADVSPGPSQDAALSRRLERLRTDLETGQDAWSRQLSADRSARLRVTQEWEAGALSLSRREATLPTGDVPELFSGSDVDAWIVRGDGWTELNLAPRPASRASREQRRLVEDALVRFADAELRYVRATAALYDFLEEHPERAESAFGRIAGDADGDGEESRLVREVNEALEEIGGFFFLEPGTDEYSMDALVRLALDPFPAELTVRTPSPPLESEGFDEIADGGLRVPEIRLRTALHALQGRWIEPDVAAAALEAVVRDEDLDFAPLATRPRRVTRPAGVDEVRDALRDALMPRSHVRVRWATPQEARPAGG